MTSLTRKARRAGVIYLVMSVLGAPTLLVLPTFIVAGDAAGTAQRIAEGGWCNHEPPRLKPGVSRGEVLVEK